LIPLQLVAQEKGKVFSRLHTIDIETKKIDTVWQGAEHIKAPKWSVIKTYNP